MIWTFCARQVCPYIKFLAQRRQGRYCVLVSIKTDMKAKRSFPCGFYYRWIVLLLCFVVETRCQFLAEEVHVDASSGNDSLECLLVQSNAPPCLSLEFIANHCNTSIFNGSLTITIDSSVVNITSVIVFQTVHDLTIQGINATNPAMLHCNQDQTGLLFNDSHDILLLNLLVHNCTFTRSSFLTFNSYGIYFVMCSQVALQGITVSESSGYGITFHNTINVTIHSSTFRQNSMRPIA